MAEKEKIDRSPAGLRLRAEARSPAKGAGSATPLSLGASNELIHELHVHQIELEMQNEELRQTMVELESSRERYFDLYELAPVGYLTLSDKGIILEANLTAASLLGERRSVLVRQPLSRFLLPEDLGTYFQHRKQVFDTGKPHACDLQLLTKAGLVTWIRLETALARSKDGNAVARMAMSDVSSRKLGEKLLDDKAQKLEQALRKMESLVALLPICGGCARIRGVLGDWLELDAFSAQRKQSEETHPLCDDCSKAVSG